VLPLTLLQGSLGALLHGSGAAAAAAAAAAAVGSALLHNPGGGAGGGGLSPTGASASDVPAGLLYRPLWPRLSALPYGASELAALESSLLRWLMESGSISRREAAEASSSRKDGGWLQRAHGGWLQRAHPAALLCCITTCPRPDIELYLLHQGFAALIPMFEDGTFICWLVSNLSGKPIVGAHRR
jgi:hypothetical protein